MKWLYFTKFVTRMELDAELEAFGEQGWELASSHRGDGADGFYMLLIFKRPKEVSE